MADAGEWPRLVQFSADRRWYGRLDLTPSYEIWLLSWLPGQHTGFHDHGEASGAFAVVRGELRGAAGAARKSGCPPPGRAAR